MKISEADIVLLPGYGKMLPGHWLLRWHDKIATAQIVSPQDVQKPSKMDWMEQLVSAVDRAARPVVLVGHCLGCTLVAHGAKALKDKIHGAFLVAPSDLDSDRWGPNFDGSGFCPVPQAPLPCPAHLIASRTDPWCAYDRAQDFASAWGATLQDAGEAGHINVESGHGPWPEGLMSFAHFMKRVG